MLKSSLYNYIDAYDMIWRLRKDVYWPGAIFTYYYKILLLYACENIRWTNRWVTNNKLSSWGA